MREIERQGNKALATIWWLFAVGWIAVLFYFSGQSAVESSALSGRIAGALLRRLTFLDIRPQTFEFFLRKLAHFGIFAVEGFLIRVALYYTKPRVLLNTVIAIAFCVPLAALNELAQLLAEGRACSLRDMFIDSAGALCGILFAALVTWMLESGSIRRKYARMRRERR
jgi:VanZ family protein